MSCSICLSNSYCHGNWQHFVQQPLQPVHVISPTHVTGKHQSTFVLLLSPTSSLADTVGYESVSPAGADMTGSMVYNQNYSVPHSLQHCTVDMVHNPSYSVSLRPTANADHPLTASTNIYEAPQ